jgi:hypothetical protein
MTDKLTLVWEKKGNSKPANYADFIYFKEIDLQCEFALQSFMQMKDIVVNDPRNSSLLALTHMLLVFAGNVVKILTINKDSNSRKKARATRLRLKLDIDGLDFSKILSARNFFEHFDEKLDKYIGGRPGAVIHRLIDDREPDEFTLGGNTFKPNYMQFLNTTTWVVTLYGDSFHLLEVIQVLEEIQKRTHKVLGELGIPSYKVAS